MSDHPTGDNDPDHPDERVELAERGDGTHAEPAAERDNIRADATAPGLDPDEGES